MSVTLLLLATSVAILAAASVSRSQGTTTRELTIAIVDPQRSSPERNEFRAQVASALQTIVSETSGANLVVHPVYVGGRDAKLKLNGGRYDAALVIGEDRPFALRRLNFVTLAGSMPATNGSQPVSLILGNADSAVNEYLRAAFTRLTSRPVTPYVASGSARLATIGG